MNRGLRIVASEAKAERQAPSNELPELLIDSADHPAAARELAARLAKVETLYQRGSELLKIARLNGAWRLTVLEPSHIIIETHKICRPLELKLVSGEPVREPATLKSSIARLLLAMPEAWNMREFNGFCATPLLDEDGALRTLHGYDATTGCFCTADAAPVIPDAPDRSQAEEALILLRSAFRSFPFADRQVVPDGSVIDIKKPPGRDESAFLVAVLTAICRPSLPLCPGILIRAPSISGAGTGKGLLIRAMTMISSGTSPTAFTTGGDRAELDKRLGSALMAADPVIFIDNVNATSLRSDLLAQAITERSCSVRPLRSSEMVALSSRSLIAVTGNGVDLSEDLARRFLMVELDSRLENPEQRPFPGGFLDDIRSRRGELLGAALTIWRWGRQNTLPEGRALGSFETWANWVRDPLIALGCKDPIERIDLIKQDDPERLAIFEFLSAWHAAYGEKPMPLKDINSEIRGALPARVRNRQGFARFATKLASTRIGGFLVTRQKHGKWNAAEYIVTKTAK